MILTIDCGNTNTVFALYSYSNTLKQEGCWRIYNNPKRTADSYYSWLIQILNSSNFNFTHITGVSIASVVPETLFNIKSLIFKYINIDPLIVAKLVPWSLYSFRSVPQRAQMADPDWKVALWIIHHQ